MVLDPQQHVTDGRQLAGLEHFFHSLSTSLVTFVNTTIPFIIFVTSNILSLSARMTLPCPVCSFVFYHYLCFKRFFIVIRTLVYNTAFDILLPSHSYRRIMDLFRPSAHFCTCIFVKTFLFQAFHNALQVVFVIFIIAGYSRSRAYWAALINIISYFIYSLKSFFIKQRSIA